MVDWEVLRLSAAAQKVPAAAIALKARRCLSSIPSQLSGTAIFSHEIGLCFGQSPIACSGNGNPGCGAGPGDVDRACGTVWHRLAARRRRPRDSLVAGAERLTRIYR